MIRIILLISIFLTFTFTILGQKCDCKGVIMPIQSPANNASISPSFTNLFIQQEAGLPWYFHNIMITEVPRMAIESFRICRDNTFVTWYVTGATIPSTLNNDTDGDYSIRMVDPMDPSLSPSNVAVTYQKNFATINGVSAYESDVSINSFSPDYSNVADVTVTSPVGTIDGPSVIRHELGHLFGADHDPDTETLMFASLAANEVKDIDCDIQEAYSQIYNCTITLNTFTCPDYKKPIEINLSHDFSIKKEKNFLIFTELDNKINSITLYEKNGLYYKMIEHKQKSLNQIKFKINSKKETYYQINYTESKSIPFKVEE